MTVSNSPSSYLPYLLVSNKIHAMEEYKHLLMIVFTCHADGTAELVRSLVDPHFPQTPSAVDVQSLFQAALQDEGLRPLPVPDVFFNWNVQRNPLLRSYIEPCSQSHAEALATAIGKVLYAELQPGS